MFALGRLSLGLPTGDGLTNASRLFVSRLNLSADRLNIWTTVGERAPRWALQIWPAHDCAQTCAFGSEVLGIDQKETGCRGDASR